MPSGFSRAHIERQERGSDVHGPACVGRKVMVEEFVVRRAIVECVGDRCRAYNKDDERSCPAKGYASLKDGGVGVHA